MQENKSNSLGSLVYSREEYATKQFWDSRYKQSSTYFDWYAEFPQLKQTFETQYSLNTSHHILMLGCGNSKLSQQMYEAGYHNIVNIDISPAVIQKMSKISEQRGYHKMKWLVMDATYMKQISDKTFDAVIDKGTLDALISGKNNQKCQKMLQQAMRVLKKDGQFILITYGSPEGRRKFFQKAISLTKYDYYFTKVDLSSMSTLINLMRSNLGNKPLNEITKDAEAMKKSLMEYNLIKVLRRNRKNQKKYIIWHDITKQATSKPQQQHQNKEISQKKQQNASQIKKQQKNSNQIQPIKQQQKKQHTGQQTSYNPKKQSFCYVYSIKQKFAIQLQQTLKQIIQQQTYPHYKHTKNQDDIIYVQGDDSLQKICIFAQGCEKELDRAITYLQLQNISNNPLIIYESLQKYKACKQRIKLHCKYANHYCTPALSKSIYQIQFVVNDNKLQKIQQRLRKACRQLVQNGGLQAHPSPHSYAYIGILMQKINPKSKYSQFLNKYWYPTYKLISYINNTAIYHLSVTPKLSQSYCLQTISQSLKSEPSTKKIKHTHAGYLNYFDPKIVNIVNYCVMNYSEKINSCLVLQQFRQISSKYEEQYRDNVIYFKRQNMAMMLARIFSGI